ncbi:unnamed protein product, partial [marine sediment metagenome]
TEILRETIPYQLESHFHSLEMAPINISMFCLI